LQSRLQGDGDAMAIAMRNEASGQRYARKLLHRMSQSLSLALLCEAAGDAQSLGNSLPSLSAWRFYEDIEPLALGCENETARRGVLALLENESMHTAKKD
jgi:hypothetical protein